MERGAGLRSKIDFGASAGREFLVSGDKIGVQVSFKNVADGQPVLFGGLQIKVHVALGIDHDCFALRPEHVRGMGQAAEIKLFEVHNQTPFGHAMLGPEDRTTNR